MRRRGDRSSQCVSEARPEKVDLKFLITSCKMDTPPTGTSPVAFGDAARAHPIVPSPAPSRMQRGRGAGSKSGLNPPAPMNHCAAASLNGYASLCPGLMSDWTRSALFLRKRT